VATCSAKFLSVLAAVFVLAGCADGGSGTGPSPAPVSTATASVTFQWDANIDTDLAGYRVYRSTTSGSFGAPIATLSASATSYQATGLQKGLQYFFVVSAYDANGNESPFSNQVSRMIP